MEVSTENSFHVLSSFKIDFRLIYSGKIVESRAIPQECELDHEKIKNSQIWVIFINLSWKQIKLAWNCFSN